MIRKESLVAQNQTLACFFVVVLVQKDNQLLLIQEAKGEKAWSLPGGQVWPGETLIQAAQREVREEAGIKIVPQGLLKIDHCVPKRKDSPEWWRFVLTAKARGGQLKTSPDPHSLQAQWFDLKNLRQMPLRSKDILKLTKLYQSGVY